MNGVDAETFRHGLGQFASGVTVVTVRGEDGRDYGMTVSSFASLSLDPPLVLVCIGDDATIADAVRSAGHFGVSVLSEAQESLARRFAGAHADRFEGAPVSRGVAGIALLDGAVAQIQCAIVARHRGGDHVIVVGEVLASSVTTPEARPLVHHRGDYRRMQ